jgi:chromosome partitioning protein
MRTVLVINSKGGCGKTTVTTNLASYYAATGARVAIKDYDAQGSSLQWLKSRPDHLPTIHGANAAPQKGHQLKSFRTWVPGDTDLLLVDAPGAVKGLLLQELMGMAGFVVIPVGPSSIDVHATADFVKDLFLLGQVRSRSTRVVVVANRVRSSMPVYEPLERFLRSLSLPFVTRIRDSDTYIRAAEQGRGVFEMDPQESAAERQEFLPILRWLDAHFGAVPVAAHPNVVDLGARRRVAV